MLAGKLRRPVIGRKIHADRAGFTRNGADQPQFELGQHAVGAQHHGDLLALAPGEGHAVDQALEVDRDPITGRPRAFRRRKFHLLLAQPLDHRVHVRFGHVGGDALDIERLDGLQREFGEHLERRHVPEVLALVDALGLDPGIARGRQLTLRDRLGKTLLHQLADHFTMHLLAELAADHVERRLPGPEAVQARGAADLLQARCDLLRDAFGRHLHLHAPLQLTGALD